MKRWSKGAGSAWLLFLAAPLVWFAHFSLLYGLASFGRVPHFGFVAWTITALACVGAAGFGYLSLRSRSSFRDMTGWLALLSLVGILFQGVSLGVLVNGA